MASITSTGIGSGLDINSIITQLVAVERQPLTKLQTEATSLQTQLSTYGKIKSGLSAVRDAAAGAGPRSTWGTDHRHQQRRHCGGGQHRRDTTLPGSYAVEVQTPGVGAVQCHRRLCLRRRAGRRRHAAHRARHLGRRPDHLHAEGGRYAIDVSVGPPAESLAQLRDKINAANAGITASVLTDASGARLVLRSSATGEANGFRIGVDRQRRQQLDGLGLSALAFDPSAGILTMAQALAAANAVGDPQRPVDLVGQQHAVERGRRHHADPEQGHDRAGAGRRASTGPDASIRKALDTFVTRLQRA